MMSQSKLGKYKEKESRDCDLIPDEVGFRGKSIKRKRRALYNIQEYNSLENMDNLYQLLNKIALTFIKQKSKVVQ